MAANKNGFLLGYDFIPVTNICSRIEIGKNDRWLYVISNEQKKIKDKNRVI